MTSRITTKPNAACRRLLIGVDLGDARVRLPPGRLVPPGSELQVDLAALELDVIDLALAVLLTASLECQHLRVPRELLQRGQHLSNGHLSRVAGCVLS
jgi:hypothetical protein